MTVRSTGQSLGPRLAQNSGITTISWMERAEQGATLKFSRYEFGDWSEPVAVIGDDRMFVNWADKPAVTAVGESEYLAHWLSYSADGPYSYDVLLSRTQDGGQSWQDAFRPHDDGTPTEHGFVSTWPANDGLGLVWLDGRNTPEDGMTLRAATIGSDNSVNDGDEIDDLVCDCCQTDVAIATSGPVAVYRNRSSEEVRDIYVSRHIDGAWQAGTPVSNDGWVIEGCPVNGPAIDARGDFVVVAWFSGAGNKPAVKVATSRNGGKTFSEPVVLAQRNALGRVGAAIVNEHAYVVSWMESDDNGSYDIQLLGLTADGQRGHTWNAGKTSEFRTVPQLIRDRDELLMAWTDRIDEESQVVSVRLQLLDFYD